MLPHDMACWYISETRDDEIARGFHNAAINRLANHMRYGQLFMNTLTTEDYNKLAGTLHDPFFSDRPHDVAMAIENVLTK